MMLLVHPRSEVRVPLSWRCQASKLGRPQASSEAPAPLTATTKRIAWLKNCIWRMLPTTCSQLAVGRPHRFSPSVHTRFASVSSKLRWTRQTMTSTAHSPPTMDKEIEVPEWEHTNTSGQTDGAHSTVNSTKATLKQKLDSMLPPRRKYLGMRRNIFIVVINTCLLALIVLIIGLAVGLTQHAKY